MSWLKINYKSLHQDLLFKVKTLFYSGVAIGLRLFDYLMDKAFCGLSCHYGILNVHSKF